MPMELNQQVKLQKKQLKRWKNCLNKLQRVFDDKTSKTDIFSQVMGQEKHGHMRMYGLGVCTSNVYSEIPSRFASYRMVMEFKSNLDTVNEQYQELSSQMEELKSLFQNGGHNNSTFASPNLVTSSSQHQVSSPITFTRQHIRVKSIVSLKSIMNSSEIVAKRVVNSMDPITKVGGVDLGPNWCEVNVQVPSKWDEQLIRPYDLFEIIGDAICAPIAWPLSLVALDEDFLLWNDDC